MSRPGDPFGDDAFDDESEDAPYPDEYYFVDDYWPDPSELDDIDPDLADPDLAECDDTDPDGAGDEGPVPAAPSPGPGSLTDPIDLLRDLDKAEQFVAEWTKEEKRRTGPGAKPSGPSASSPAHPPASRPGAGTDTPTDVRDGEQPSRPDPQPKPPRGRRRLLGQASSGPVGPGKGPRGRSTPGRGTPGQVPPPKGPGDGPADAKRFRVPVPDPADVGRVTPGQDPDLVERRDALIGAPRAGLSSAAIADRENVLRRCGNPDELTAWSHWEHTANFDKIARGYRVAAALPHGPIPTPTHPSLAGDDIRTQVVCQDAAVDAVIGWLKLLFASHVDATSDVPLVPPLLLSGPPGVGKTTLLRVLAAAAGLPGTTSVQVNGASAIDIAGTGIVYDGAKPGAVLVALADRKPGVILVFDEVDKASSAPNWGRPLEALLGLFDSPSNRVFRDNFFGDIPFRLPVVVAATANELERIPGPVRDRMYEVPFTGYSAAQAERVVTEVLWPRVAQDLAVPHAVLTPTAARRVVRATHRTDGGLRRVEQALQLVTVHDVDRMLDARRSAGDGFVVDDDQVDDALAHFAPDATEESDSGGDPGMYL